MSILQIKQKILGNHGFSLPLAKSEIKSSAQTWKGLQQCFDRYVHKKQVPWEKYLCLPPSVMEELCLPRSVTGEVYCFPRRQLIFSFDRRVIHNSKGL